MESFKLEKNPPKRLKKEDIYGLLFGISLCWVIGLRGVTPYIIGTFFGIWFTRKMIITEKKYIKIIFSIIFVSVIVIGIMFRGMQSGSHYSSYQDTEDTSSNILTEPRTTSLPKLPKLPKQPIPN